MIYVVSYTLNPKRVNNELVTALQASPNWAHYMDDTWMISTWETKEQLWGRMVGALQTSDRILITSLGRDSVYWGWLPEEAWTWVTQHRFEYG